MADTANPNVVIGIKLKKSPQSAEFNAVNSFPGHWSVSNLYDDIHGKIKAASLICSMWLQRYVCNIRKHNMHSTLEGQLLYHM